MAGAGGRHRAVAARIVARQEFAGYWEYVLDDAPEPGGGVEAHDVAGEAAPVMGGQPHRLGLGDEVADPPPA
jgi:hypothetical protein